jgi:hypothetical protein
MAVVAFVFRDKLAISSDPRIVAFFGSLLGAFASVFLWVMTQRKERREKQTAKANFEILVWTELRGLARILYDEAKAWDEATGNKPTGQETEFKHKGRRITVFQLAATQANLNRLHDLGPIVAEGVVATMATLSTLPTIVQLTFEFDEDKYDEFRRATFPYEKAFAEGGITETLYKSWLRRDCAQPNIDQYNLRIKVIERLLYISEQAFQTAHKLDKNGVFRQYQVSTLSEIQRIEQEQELADMKLMYAQFRTL